MLLAADGSAKIGDVGMARYMPRDYLTSNTAAGTLAWAVRAGLRVLEAVCGRTCAAWHGLRLLTASLHVRMAQVHPVPKCAGRPTAEDV